MKAAEIQFEDIHRRIDPQAVLDYYGADNQRVEHNEDGTEEVIHSCLIDRVDPHHQNGDANPSAACNLDKKLYTCYSYVDPETNKSGYDMLHLIMKMEGKKDPHAVMGLVSGFLDDATATTDDFMAELDRILAAATEPQALAAPIRTLPTRSLEPWAFVHPYVVGRGIDVDTASRLHIGYDQLTNRITIPHFWGGNLVGWQKRAVPNRPGEWPGTVPAMPKYRSSPGFPKAETLYRLDEARMARRMDTLTLTGGAVIVVESPFSAIKAEAVGLRGVTATFGAKITDGQVAHLLNDIDPRIVVWMDPDNAGRSAERRLVEKLHRKAKVTVVEPDEGQDMGDCDTLDEMMDKIASAVPASEKLAQYDEERAKWARNDRAKGRSRRASV
jgi:5S rRNA maturation endonuclease (ribonuclease M5)